MITVGVEAPGDEPPLPTAEVESLIRAVFIDHDTSAARATVIFTDDEHLRRLKKTYLNTDAYTDVIAFELNGTGEPLEAEIYISVDRARENCATYGETLERELRRLVIHGSLHLMGESDATLAEQDAMRRLEDSYLDAVRREPT